MWVSRGTLAACDPGARPHRRQRRPDHAPGGAGSRALHGDDQRTLASRHMDHRPARRLCPKRRLGELGRVRRAPSGNAHERRTCCDSERPSALSHDSAAHLHRLPIASAPAGCSCTYTRPGFRSAQVRAGVERRGARCHAEPGGPHRRRPGARPGPQPQSNMAREYGVRGGLPTFDAALRAGVSPSPAVGRKSNRMARAGPIVAAPRICAELGDPGAGERHRVGLGARAAARTRQSARRTPPVAGASSPTERVDVV